MNSLAVDRDKSAVAAEKAVSMKSPLHPIFVHFTVALSSMSFIFDGLAAAGVEAFRDIGWWLLVAAVIATCATVATGIYSRTRLMVPENSARRFLRTHMALGPTLFGALIMLLVWRAFIWQANAFVAGWYFAGMLAVFSLLLVQAYLGGELVYRFGMEVRGDYRKTGELIE